MAVTIEPIRPDQIAAFNHAVDVVARERKYLSFLEGPPLAMTREFVLNNITKGHPQFVALSQGEVIGWCDVVPLTRPIHAHTGVLGIGLMPAFRGKGLGKRLIEMTLPAARRFGLSRIELTVHADNGRAVGLYERVGFQREGVKRDAALIDGSYKDVIMMAIVRRPRDK